MKSSEIRWPAVRGLAPRRRRRRCQVRPRPPARRPQFGCGRGRRVPPARAPHPLPPHHRRASAPRLHLLLAPLRMQAKRKREMGGLRAASTAFATLGPRRGSSARRWRMSASTWTLDRRIPVGSAADMISHSTRPLMRVHAVQVGQSMRTWQGGRQCQSMRTWQGGRQLTRQAWWTRQSARRPRWLLPQQMRLVCVCVCGHVRARLHVLCD